MTLELASCPEETISQIEFNPSSSKLVVSSWDSRVKIYDIAENRLIADYCHIGPVLGCCWVEDKHVASVGADRQIYLFNTLQPGSEPQIIGSHSDTIKCVAYCALKKCLVTASWDKTVHFWHVSEESFDCKLMKTITVDEKPHAISISPIDGRIVLACDDRNIYLIEGSLDNYFASLRIVKNRGPILKHPTRDICVFPDGSSWCTSSTEGRVSIEYFDMEKNASLRYTFKCHRQTKEGIEYVYPVNALAVYPKWGTFATGGSDGYVYIWNRDLKRRLKTLPSFSTTISRLAFSLDGKNLAIAASYVYDQGEQQNQKHSVFVYPIYEADVNPSLIS